MITIGHDNGGDDGRIKDGWSCEYVKRNRPGRGQEALEQIPKLLDQALNAFCNTIGGLGDCADFGEDDGGSANFSDDVGAIGLVHSMINAMMVN